MGFFDKLFPKNNILCAEDKLSRAWWVDAGLAFVIAAVITCTVPVVADYAMNKPIPLLWLLAVFIPMCLIAYARLRLMEILYWAESWQTFSVVANSRAAVLLTAAFSIVPTVVTVAKGMELEQKLPFTLYLYWVSGFMMVIFLVLFRATAPAVYRYKSYKELVEREGGLQVLREDLDELKELVDNKLAPFDAPNGHAFLDQDAADIKWLQTTDRNEGPELYFLMQKYSARLRKWKRALLTPLLVIPAFVLITTTLSNTLQVGVEASEQAHCNGGFIQSIYRGVLSLNPYYNKAREQVPTGCLETPVHNG